MSYEFATEILGQPGQMLSASKQHPLGREDHTIYWNACVFMTKERSSKAKHKSAEQIWHGDIDLTERAGELQKLANKLAHTIYVTPEQPWRFDGFAACMKRYDPRWDYRRPPIRFDPE